MYQHHFRPLFLAAAVLVIGAAAHATVHVPDWYLTAEGSLENLEPGDPIDFTVLVHSKPGLEIGAPLVRGDVALGMWSDSMQPDFAKSSGNNGYEVHRIPIHGVYDGNSVSIDLDLLIDGEVITEKIPLPDKSVLRTLPKQYFGPRIRLNVTGIETPAPNSTFETTSNEPMKVPRSVRIHGSLLMTVPPVRAGESATVHGVDGATVKLMEPVFFLDDNTIGEDVTNPDGTFDFTVMLDGTPDVYVKFEGANGTAVNVGSGLFFSTYNRQIPYDDFGGTEIYLPDRIYSDEFNEVLGITTILTRAKRWYDSKGVSLPRVHVRWPDDSRRTSFYNPTGGLEGLHLRRDRAFNSGTLFHEYGHHFVSQRSAQVSPPYYCNDLCDDGGQCGHCLWCEENEAVAWSEGLPNWLAWVMDRDYNILYGTELPGRRDLEAIARCGPKGTYDNPISTEGFFTAFLQDLTDGVNENDTAIDPLSADVSEIDPLEILHVATVDRPSTSHDFIRLMRDHLESLPGTLPGDIANYWSTARNNGLVTDSVNPAPPVSISSSTHPVGVASRSNMPTLFVTPGSDDFTGVQAHYITMTRDAPAEPVGGGIILLGNSLVWTNPLDPGIWYANVRSVDGGGNQSIGWLSYGPMVVDTPIPVDLVPTVDLLWEDSLIARNTNDGNPTATGWPSQLYPGDVYLNHLFKNGSLSGAAGDSFQVTYAIDGAYATTAEVIDTSIGAGELYAQNNLGPFALAGGRHRIAASLDSGNDLAELDETNNSTVVSVVVQPDLIPFDSMLDFPAAPPREGGKDPGDTYPDNVVGHRISPANTFSGVSILANYPRSGYSVQPFEPATGTFDGFENPLGPYASSSGVNAGFLVVSNQPVAHNDFDLGISTNQDRHDSGYSLQATDASPLLLSTYLGGYVSAGMPDFMYMFLLEFDVTPADLGWLNIALEAQFEGGPRFQYIGAKWIPAADVATSISDLNADVLTDDEGFGDFTVDLLSPGKYCLAVFRYYSGSVSVRPVDIQIGLTQLPRPDLTIYPRDPVFGAGFVPNWEISQEDTLTFPVELFGDIASTYLNFALINDGYATIPSPPAEIQLEGIKITNFNLGPIQPGERLEYRGTTGFTIPSGRRTLKLVLDPDNLLTEVHEGNNYFALQMGWTGPTLLPDNTIERNAIPERSLGLDELTPVYALQEGPDGEDGIQVPLTFTAPNCDGVRLDTSVFPKANGNWVGVAMMPGWDNIDLRLHQGGVPAAEAFVDVLTTSFAQTGKLGYVLANLAEGAGGPFDIGLVSVIGEEPYNIMATQSLDLGNPGIYSTHGPFQLKSSELMDLYEFDLEPGFYSIDLLNMAGGAALGISVHPPLSPSQTPYHSRSDLGSTPNGWEFGPGFNQYASVQVRDGMGGKWCVAVWKQETGDVDINADYEITVNAQLFTPSLITVDGQVDQSYGQALDVQTTQTFTGSNTDQDPATATGSELDQIFGVVDNGFLFLNIAGNLKTDFSKLEIFLDTDSGGQGRIRGDNPDVDDDALGRMGDDGNGNGLAFDQGFEADWYLTISGGEDPTVFDVYMAELLDGGGGQSWYLGSTLAISNSLLHGPAPDTSNPAGIRMAFDNSNTGGVGTGSGPDSGADVYTGIELAIPLAALGYPPVCIKACMFINEPDRSFVYNQVLGPAPPGTIALGDPREIDFETVDGRQYVYICPTQTAATDDTPLLPDGVLVQLHRPSPNPFNPRTTLSFTLARASAVTLTIHDVSGRVVRRIISSQVHQAGVHTLDWRGMDERGNTVASGVYFARLEALGTSETQRMILLK